jgi:cytochrome d ubiquinol oxidase subunit II
MLTLPWLDLPLVWAALIAVAVLVYVLLDGFDLGCGILFLAERDQSARNIIVNSIAPVWDGNETWLVLGGGGLLAVFPLAYATIMPALYPTMIGMLLALIFRGVAFEFRFRAATQTGRALWDIAFCAGSALAAFCQGLTLGGLVQGVKTANRAYAGGYALLGATWLIWRTEGELQTRCRGYARNLGIATLSLIGVVSLWTPMLNPSFNARWFHWPGIALTSPVPILLAFLAWRFWRGLTKCEQISPFLTVLGWFALCFTGLGISMFPNIVPPSITIWDAAAPPESQAFLLVGTVILLPMILAYTGYAYWTFRGKVTSEVHYH